MSDSQPPPSIPPGVPKSSNTPFILAAIAMLLLMAGLIVWKLSSSGSSAEPQPAVVASATPAPEAPLLEEPPPPPPPLEEPEDAGVKTAKSEKKSVAGAPASGGCAGVCTGTEGAGFRGQLAGVARRAHGCYERALRNNEMLQGRMMVKVRVGPNGQVCSANVASNQTGDASLSTCVQQMFRSAQFASPQNGCVEAEVPLNFVPKQ